MDPRPGKDKRARTTEDERKRIWDALLADNEQLLCPADDKPEEDLYCLVCSQILKGTGAKYAVANAVGHMKTNIHQKKVQEVNASRAVHGQHALPDFVEKTAEQLSGQRRIHSFFGPSGGPAIGGQASGSQAASGFQFTGTSDAGVSSVGLESAALPPATFQQRTVPCRGVVSHTRLNQK